MKDSKFYWAVTLIAVVLVVADLSYFSGLEVAEAAPSVAEAQHVDEAGAMEAAAEDQAPGAVDPRVADQAPGAVDPRVAEQVPVASGAECTYDPAIQPVPNHQALIQMGDPFLGDEKARVTVIEFFDPNCPHCRTMHPVMQRVVDSHGDKARFYMIPFMLWPDISLLPIEALYVAAQDGKYFEMLEQQYLRQNPNGFTPDQLKDMAVSIGLDGAKFQDRLARGLNRQAIAQRRLQIQQLGIRGTPAVMINGRVISGEAKTIACMRQMIDEAAAAG